MEEPPDPGGSAVLDVSCYVTVSNDSAMDTDASVASTASASVKERKRLKRTQLNKMCKHCNKRRRNKRNSSTADLKENDCTCGSIDIMVENPKKTSVNDRTPFVSNKQIINLPTNSPPTPVGRSAYVHTDVAPFVVHVQKNQTSPDDNTILHPIAFGKFLKGQSFQHIVNGSLKRIGRNRISLAFTHFDKANEFINHASLTNQNFKAFIPNFQITRMGLVRGVPAEWSVEEISDNVTVPIGCGKITKIRRLNYKTTVDGSPVWKPSQTVVLTFDGQVLPKRVFMCYNALPVELYIYPSIQCYQCARFGHTKTACRSKPRCYKCGHQHNADSCNIDETNATCCLCSGRHFATSKCCPEHDRQKRIKRSMAETCISYPEACKLHPPVEKSYAEVLTNRPAVIKNLPSPSPQTSSYRKTVFLKPRSPQSPTKGYNRKLHNELVKEYNMPSPSDGCAYNTNSPKADEQSITDIVMALINTLSQSTIVKPDHVAFIIESLQKIIHVHNGYGPTDIISQ